MQISRRHFLQALGAAALLPACTTPREPGGRRLIDTHYHFFPPQFQQASIEWETKRNIPRFPAAAAWTRARAVEELDRSGIRTAMLSLPSIPGTWFDFDARGAARMARICNDYAAQMARDYPGRFGVFAALPMLDTESSLREIEYALDVLKADGIGLQTNYGDKWPGDPVYRPIFDELNRRKALVYFHPLVASCCARLSVGTFPAVLEVPHDTTRAAASLLLSGSFARDRDIKWLFSHAGGTVPMLAGRMDYFFRSRQDLARFAPDGVEAEFRRLYYDTASSTHPASMAALLKVVPDTQVVFGSDYPYVPVAEQATALRTLDLSAAQVRAIESGNAMKLIPRLS